MARRKAMSTSGKTAIKPTAATTSQVSAPSTRTATNPGGSARDASRARREAMSQGGKASIQNKDRTRQSPGAATASPATPSAPANADDRPKGGCGCGCNGTKTTCTDGPGNNAQAPAPMKRALVAPKSSQRNNVSTARAASLARREAMSTRGKAGLNSSGMSAAQTARAGNPNMSSRELAMSLREQRSRNGKSGEQKCKPTGRMRQKADAETGAAEDQPWKVGAGKTAQGQVVTGTMVGRSASVTGDEPSTCRTVTGTEYLGADIFREFCQAEPGKTPSKVGVSATSHGNPVTGNRVGRGSNVTGNEPGTCKNITGSEYVGASQAESYCGTKAEAGPSKITSAETRKGKLLTGSNVGRSGKVTGDETGASRELTGTQYMQAGNGKAPSKVGSSTTLRGGGITGTMVGRGERVTGDEPGSCRDVTGDDYIGQEQYGSFCGKTPQANDFKVGVSATLMGKAVTGTMTDRGANVTGNEAGTCKALTGTPYAGAAATEAYCASPETAMAMARAHKGTTNVGPSMTGIQPGINGVMTGAEKGACESVTGTAYVGADQAASACPASAATPASPDFPQPVEGQPWGEFSVTQPSGGAQQGGSMASVTGSRYEQGHITGPFGMATGKVTGTEEARFDNKGAGMPAARMPATAEMVEGRVKSRITGEGQDVGLKITGDDWERNESVTGTEGTSATRRNPTVRGAPMDSMAVANKRNEEVPVPVSKVTGSSGNTEKGSLITYSGGARG